MSPEQAPALRGKQGKRWAGSGEALAPRWRACRPFHPHDERMPVPRGRFLTYDIEIWPTAARLAKGHRLQVQLTSNDTINHLDAHVELGREGTDVRPLEPALNTVRFGGAGSSALTIPALDRRRSPLRAPLDDEK